MWLYSYYIPYAYFYICITCSYRCYTVWCNTHAFIIDLIGLKHNQTFYIGQSPFLLSFKYVWRTSWIFSRNISVQESVENVIVSLTHFFPKTSLFVVVCVYTTSVVYFHWLPTFIINKMRSSNLPYTTCTSAVFTKWVYVPKQTSKLHWFSLIHSFI